MDFDITKPGKIRYSLVLSVVVAALLVTLPCQFDFRAQSSTAEARITAITGVATISGNGRSRMRPLLNELVLPGDEIDTRGGGSIVVDLTDGSQVVILPGSLVVFADYQNATSLRELLQITIGRIRVRINHFKGTPNPYRIKSPTASIAVRGTEFEVNVLALGETRVVVTSGAVDVTSLRNPDRHLIAEPGHGVVVRPNFTLDTFLSAITTREADEQRKQARGDDVNRENAEGFGSLQSAESVFERSIESIVESGETALPSRFTAFSDNFLDSFENPAFAGNFTHPEGRITLLPSINGITIGGEDVRDRFGLRARHPLDYSFVPQTSFFVPITRFGVVVGGSASYARSGSQSLMAFENQVLAGPAFPVGSTGLVTGSGITTNDMLESSVMVAKGFGSRNKLNLGFSLERLTTKGYLSESSAERDSSGLSFTEQVISRSWANRTRYTVGVKYDFQKSRLGAFYRHTNSSGSNSDQNRLVDGVQQTNGLFRSTGISSEFGFRLRGAFYPHLFYGLEGTLLFERTRGHDHGPLIVDSSDRDSTVRGTLGFGLGYIVRRHTILSFDASGGFIEGKRFRFEDVTGNTLETERFRSPYLSFYSAVQRDLWNNLFVGASILALIQSRTTDSVLLPDRFGNIVNKDGIFVPSGRLTGISNDFYSSFGIGWRFRPNFVLQYVLTTDYGQTNFRHILLFRYSFGFRKE